jgi:hypothetical protein
VSPWSATAPFSGRPTVFWGAQTPNPAQDRQMDKIRPHFFVLCNCPMAWQFTPGEKWASESSRPAGAGPWAEATLAQLISSSASQPLGCHFCSCIFLPSMWLGEGSDSCKAAQLSTAKAGVGAGSRTACLKSILGPSAVRPR